MAYKTGGLKTKYINAYGYYSEEYTIYRANESVSDTDRYIMVNSNGDEVPIQVDAIDGSDKGKYNIIDCLYAISHLGIGAHTLGKYESENVVVEEMTEEEMNRIFG